jgi:lysozyme family protein
MLSLRTATILSISVIFIWLSNGFTSVRYDNINHDTNGTFRFGWTSIIRESEEVGIMEFNQIIEKVLEHEGGYVNDKDDLGGETKYGITKRFYPHLNIKELTREQAKEIYYKDYWIPSKAHKLPEHLRYPYFDCVVNTGQRRAVKILQQACNNKNTFEIKEDGLIGAATISACKKLEEDRFVSYRILFYSLLISENPTQEKFWYGWYKRAKGE